MEISAHCGVVMGSSRGMTVPSPEDFGIHKGEGGNLHLELSHVLHFPTLLPGNFPRNPVARSSVIEVCCVAYC